MLSFALTHIKIECFKFNQKILIYFQFVKLIAVNIVEFVIKQSIYLYAQCVNYARLVAETEFRFLCNANANAIYGKSEENIQKVFFSFGWFLIAAF